MNGYNYYTKDYLFALLISGDNKEKEYALQELCNRYKEISYYGIKRLVKEHKNNFKGEIMLWVRINYKKKD